MMRPIRKQLLIALVTALLLVLSAVPASADGGRINRGGDDGGFARLLGGDDGGFGR